MELIEEKGALSVKAVLHPKPPVPDLVQFTALLSSSSHIFHRSSLSSIFVFFLIIINPSAASEGLDQQGIYRVPGEKRVIESLQASIDELGEPAGDEVDSASLETKTLISHLFLSLRCFGRQHMGRFL